MTWLNEKHLNIQNSIIYALECSILEVCTHKRFIYMSIQIISTDIYNSFKALLIPDIFVQSPICFCFKYKVKLINVRIVATYKSLKSATLNYDISNFKKSPRLRNSIY